MYKNSSGSQLSQNRLEREEKVKQISYGRQFLSKIKETKYNREGYTELGMKFKYHNSIFSSV